MSLSNQGCKGSKIAVSIVQKLDDGAEALVRLNISKRFESGFMHLEQT